MGVSDRRLGQILQDILLVAAAPILAYYLARQLLGSLDPEAGNKADAKKKALAASSRLQSIISNNHDDDEDDSEQRPKVQDLNLSAYEQTIAMEVVSPQEIPVTFADIGGLEQIIDELRESVIYPLTMPQLYASHSSLLTAPSGVLLYGPPGCGKTMLAKALARESGACFINLHISTLTEKWYGDSNKLVAAVFSLARKLQPCIVFIDEIDAVLGQRRSGEHEASGMVKAEFMTHWDGLASSTIDKGAQRICILGATNRIQDIDEAILRRMPKKFPVSLPQAAQRKQIFKMTLRDTRIDAQRFDLDKLVRLSAGMSGSDIKEACRDAAMVPIREFSRTIKNSGRGMKNINPGKVRGLRTEDFIGRQGGHLQLREDEIDEPQSDKVVEQADEAEEWEDEEEGDASRA
ncbi:hypothetical protein AMS68_006460 [Peltaster fructicola]|uniref:AAA+ ATPase domain-containing protein n=1 Tax=Peltaster fructicola TaxID=286661 RepID=A0A6H0Y1R0_9PEZI|nr:hypothetical protein AMS68_006460 [Peltaster fructicola]